MGRIPSFSSQYDDECWWPMGCIGQYYSQSVWFVAGTVHTLTKQLLNRVILSRATHGLGSSGTLPAYCCDGEIAPLFATLSHRGQLRY